MTNQAQAAEIKRLHAVCRELESQNERLRFASAGTVPPRSAFRRSIDIAIQYGAKPFRGPADSPVFQCWADRIAWLPSAAERGPEALAAAVAEANRYAGR
jgi:hypothetical protein